MIYDARGTAMLEGKRVVVTGASRGIGRAIALACARAGAMVGAGWRSSEDEAASLAAECPGRIRPLRIDVRDPERIEAAADRFAREAGGIDGWVNNAGVNRAALLAAAPIDGIRETIEVNLLGAILCARAAIPRMLEAGGGVLVNVGSVAAARPARGQAAYAASKGGLEALTRALAVEYGRKGIRVHCLAPGPAETAMLAPARAIAEGEVLARIPAGRVARPAEIAEAAVFLLSDAAAYATGSVTVVDGGFLQA